MDIFKILANIYTNRSCKWLNDVEESDIQPYVLQRWLAMNDEIRVQVRWLDQYVYVLPSKMYLSLAWSVIPKYDKMPFVKYIKKEEKVSDKMEFILARIRKIMKLSDNDWRIAKPRFEKEVSKDIISWFIMLGVESEVWKKYGLPFALMKQRHIAVPKRIITGGLSKFLNSYDGVKLS